MKKLKQARTLADEEQTTYFEDFTVLLVLVLSSGDGVERLRRFPQQQTPAARVPRQLQKKKPLYNVQLNCIFQSNSSQLTCSSEVHVLLASASAFCDRLTCGESPREYDSGIASSGSHCACSSTRCAFDFRSRCSLMRRHSSACSRHKI